MKVNYVFYEVNQGYEEIQAQIYNESTRKYGESGLASADQIRQRYQTEKTDPKGVRYALREDGHPLAYIQTRLDPNQKRTWIGYPWATEDCPSEVQEKIFNEMLDYIIKRDPANEIVMGYISDKFIETVNFARNRNYPAKDIFNRYSVNVEELIEKERDLAYSARKASQKDLYLLLELSKADPDLENAFSTEEARTVYFKDRVLPDGHTILIIKDKQVVCAGAPLHGYRNDGVILRFFASLPKYKATLRELLIEIAKHNIETGWNNLPLLVGIGKNEKLEALLAELDATIYEKQVLYQVKSG